MMMMVVNIYQLKIDVKHLIQEHNRNALVTLNQMYRPVLQLL